MNAVEKNAFTSTLKELGKALTKPRAVCCVSAHWYGGGTFVSTAESPKTIHDFGGFPEALYRIQYPAPGHPGLARKAADLLGYETDETRGLDHGAWSVLRHLFPEADVPVFQVSLDATLGMEGHWEAGRRLTALRREGILLLGSGNITHNLGDLSWEDDAPIFAWAESFDGAVRDALRQGDSAVLTHPSRLPHYRRAVPTPDHYLPLLWMLGAAEGEKPSFIYEGFQNGSLSMRSVRWG